MIQFVAKSLELALGCATLRESENGGEAITPHYKSTDGCADKARG